MTTTAGPRPDQVTGWEQVALVDLLDRVLVTGVVVTGEVTISIADVDLMYVSLQALVSSVRRGGPGSVPARRGSGPEPARGERDDVPA